MIMNHQRWYRRTILPNAPEVDSMYYMAYGQEYSEEKYNRIMNRRRGTCIYERGVSVYNVTKKGTYVITLPATVPEGFSIDLTKLLNVDNEQLTFDDTHPDWLTSGSQEQWTGYVSDEERKRRRDAGECEECGTKREMSIHGLLDCPLHPKKPGYV